MPEPAEDPRPLVVIGMLGVVKDSGAGEKRWLKWRPTVAACTAPELPVARLDLIAQPWHMDIAATVAADIRERSPATETALHGVAIDDPWDFEQVYAALADWAEAYPFDTERERYALHMTTGTHVVQIVLFLLAETRAVPAVLLQAAPPRPGADGGSVQLVDLDLGRYDRLARRAARRAEARRADLRLGLPSADAAYDRLISLVERVAVASDAPMLFTGATGTGKTALARRVYHAKRAAGRLRRDRFEAVNCAALRGDTLLSTLFGHVRGAFTGADRVREGHLRRADGGVLFLDEIGDLPLEAQAVLLTALEDGRFRPLGADADVESRFTLLAGTHRDLAADVAAGRFREDLLARIALWSFHLPALRDRPLDLAANLDYELDRVSDATGRRVTMSREARERFLAFATAPDALWSGNFRDLGAAVARMSTLADAGRITTADVDAETARLRAAWRGAAADPLDAVLGPERAADLDLFDRAQLAAVVAVVRQSASLSDAGRRLFAASRARRATTNDADRLRKYLARFGLTFDAIRAA